MPLPEFLQPLTETDLGSQYLEAPILTDAKDLKSVAKQLVDYQRMAGEQVRVPGKEADADAWNGFMDKLKSKGALEADAVRGAFLKVIGVPDDKDGYALKPDELPAGLQWDEKAEAFWKEKFHELGIPAEAGKGLMAAFIDRQKEAGEAAAAAADERKKAIEEAFGQATDATLSKVMTVASTYGGDEMVESMKTADVGTLKMMAKIAEQFDVKGDGEFNSQGERVLMSPTEAKAQLTEVNKKLFDESLPRKERRRLEDEAVRLQYLIMGEKPRGTLALD